MINADIIKTLEAIPVLEGPGGVRFIRASDLPDTVRPEFERWLIGSETPHIPGEMPGDPVREDDYVAWLNTLRP
jgi:hypothetical protein